MRGARHYRPDASTRLKKCSEHIGDDCTLCCAVTPCAYCLELEIYGETIKHGYAPESADHWTGTVDGHAFDAFWERNQYTDECEFVVELDSVEVYRKSCYEGQECRDSSDETGVTIGYDEATLRWIKHEPLPLPHIIGDEDCPTWFCGECECSCECVCVTITEPDSTVIRGELCNVAYECEGPRWEGQIGYYDLALALGRDSYGNCVLESTVNGDAEDAVSVVGCKDMSAVITLYDGTTIEVGCKVCDCSLTVVPVYPCECRPDALAVFWGELTAGTGSPCEKAITSASVATTPTANKAWNDLDCVNTILSENLITANPPDCVETDLDILNKRVVFVQKLVDATHPNRDDTGLEVYDWYAVVYNATDDTLLGVFYEWEICCQNDTPEDAATSHLAWIKFPNVIMQGAGYTMIWYNVTTAAAYGNCGYDFPF